MESASRRSAPRSNKVRLSSRSIAAELLQEFSALGANDRARTEVPSALGEMTAGVSVIKDPKSVAQIVSQAVKDADAPTSDAGITPTSSPNLKPKPSPNSIQRQIHAGIQSTPETGNVIIVPGWLHFP